MYKIWKYFEKRQVIACDNRMQQTAGIGPVHCPDRAKLSKMFEIPVAKSFFGHYRLLTKKTLSWVFSGKWF